MNKVIRKRLGAFVASIMVLCLSAFPFAASAEIEQNTTVSDTAVTDSDTGIEEVSVTVVLTDSKNSITVSGAEVSMYKIADFTDYQTHEFTAVEGFEEIISQLDFSSSQKACTKANAESLLSFIKENDVRAQAETTSDVNGIAAFGSVEKGIYLIETEAGDTYSISPFLVEAPLCENGKFYGEVKASPKFIDENVRSESPEEPDEPTESSEPDTPKSGGGTGSNSTKIPQTGQLKWIVPVLTVLGITFIVLGYADYCFRGKSREED